MLPIIPVIVAIPEFHSCLTLAAKNINRLKTMKLANPLNAIVI